MSSYGQSGEMHNIVHPFSQRNRLLSLRPLLVKMGNYTKLNGSTRQFRMKGYTSAKSEIFRIICRNFNKS